jgi:hypothetical protein
MTYAAGVIVVIGVGLPLGAWLLTRRIARRPPGELGRGDRVDDWLRQEYGLAWLERSRIQAAVAAGRRVSDPALEGAAHGLAARTLNGGLKADQQQRFAGLINLGISTLAFAAGVVDLLRHPSQHATLFLIPWGVFLAAYGSFTFFWLPKRRRQAAARALELNQAAAVGP